MPALHEPSVSVIINNYNYASFLGEAIESALAQSYRRREIVVVDDGSTDDSRAVIAKYANHIVPVLKPNGGQASAYNAGFAASRGELIFFLDADDVWLPNKLEMMVALAADYPRAVCLSHRLQEIDADGRRLPAVFPKDMPCGSIVDRVVRSGGYWPNSFSSGSGFRRSFLERVLPMPEEPYRMNADFYLLTIAPFVGEVAGSKQALALYRVHGRNGWRDNGARTDSEERKRKMVEFQRSHIARVNRTLAALDVPHRIREDDNWALQVLRRQLAEGYSLPRLIWQGLRWPGQMRFRARLKGTVVNTLAILRADRQRSRYPLLKRST